MLFNSLEFAVYLPIVFLLFWFACGKKVSRQNILIVLASYLFYGIWDWRFLGLIFASTLVDFFLANQLYKTQNRVLKKQLLGVSLLVNLGALVFFKYFDFFIENFSEVFTLFGVGFNYSSLQIILPVGISFYTFQTLSYTIDTYRGKLKPSTDFIAFAAFVSFFPQLVAGPIERATNLLPQFSKPKVFDYTNAVRGLRQILWGLFKKIVIADNCAEHANYFFNSSGDHLGSDLYLAAIFFAFQIYGDFSGYSDIAIGTARLFGFNLMQNFSYPYFSRDIAEFWRRWHISLSSWFRDYVYIPLGGSRVTTLLKVRNVFIIFIVSGFWHGANWTYIIWGILHAIYFLPLLLSNRNRQYSSDIVAKNKQVPSLKDLFKMWTTFNLTVIAWVFFRSEDVQSATSYLLNMFSASLFSLPSKIPKQLLFLVLFFILLEWFGRKEDFALNVTRNWKKPYSYLLYYILLFFIFWFGGKEQQFIYFQF